ncbi:MAG: kynureninase [Bacteroidota bacterium]|jgi:kynureninase
MPNIAPMMTFDQLQAAAQAMDAADELRELRDAYCFPEHEGRPVLYFTGNSLGLQPKAVRQALMEECDDWAKFGVEGHMESRRPWFSYHEQFAEPAARLVGALPHEVVVMNQLTVNLHLLLTTFYRPSGKRIKILFEQKPFPSDQYAFESHAKLHGLNPDDVLVELPYSAGCTYHKTEDIEAAIASMGDELALVCFGGVNYFTGQLFDMQRIAAAAHAVGAYAGFDLAHAAGNAVLALHDWKVDFACWCSYKYLNSGPGGVAGAFIHEDHARRPDLIRLAGWWGHDKSTRFQMKNGFVPIPTAEAWQLSNAPIMSMAVHRVALELFDRVGMSTLRAKSEKLTAFLDEVLNTVRAESGWDLQVLTPSDPKSRGCQLSVVLPGKDRSFVKALASKGAVVDWREPNVIRVAPVPMYNTFEDVYRLGKLLFELR